MTENEMKQIEGLFTHQLGIFAEDVQHKFDLVIEGQQLLSERMDHMKTELKSDIDRVDKRLTSVDGSLIKKIDGVEGRLSKKLDGVAADLKAHRADTEAHRSYGVRED